MKAMLESIEVYKKIREAKKKRDLIMKLKYTTVVFPR